MHIKEWIRYKKARDAYLNDELSEDNFCEYCATNDIPEHTQLNQLRVKIAEIIKRKKRIERLKVISENYVKMQNF